MKKSQEFGILAGEMSLDFAKVMSRKEQVVDTLVSGVDKLLKAAKVRVIYGWGEFTKPGQLEVQNGNDRQTVSVENIVLATGSIPASIPISGVDLPGVVTSDEILKENELPHRLVIIGGGVIGLEFASVFSAMGVKVTVVEMLPSLLANMDEEISKRLLPLLKRQGIEIMTKTAVESIRQEGGSLVVQAKNGTQVQEIPADRVLIATGRKPNLQGIKVKELGIETERGALVVNAQMQTNLHKVYAIGDVVGGIMLAHVASNEGIIVAEHIAGQDVAMSYRAIPSAVFTYPEIATVGLTEQELKASGVDYRVSKFPFSANGKALALGDSMGLVKILADQAGVIVGGSIIGTQASSLIQELVVAVEKRMTGEELAHIVHAHPTLPEAIMEAAHGVKGKALHMA